MINLREYAFERFKENFLAAERKQDHRTVGELMGIAANRWKTDYHLLAAVWLFLFQRWTVAAENQQYELARYYGAMVEMIHIAVARRNLSSEDYKAFGRLTQDPFGTSCENVLHDGI